MLMFTPGTIASSLFGLVVLFSACYLLGRLDSRLKQRKLERDDALLRTLMREIGARLRDVSKYESTFELHAGHLAEEACKQRWQPVDQHTDAAIQALRDGNRELALGELTLAVVNAQDAAEHVQGFDL